MADDSKAYSDRQKQHGEKIRAERTVMRMTGLTRSAIRAIESFKQELDKQAPLTTPPETKVSVPPTQIGVNSVFFPSKGFSSAPRGGEVSASTPPATNETVAALVVNNGFLHEATLVGSLGPVVPL